jgi:hypothetical protein
MLRFPKNIRRSLVALALTASLSVGEAMAACTQADVGGSWQAYSFGYQQGYEPYWTHCTLQVKLNGVIENGGSVCTSSTGYRTSIWGYLRLIGTQGCIFSGYLVQNGIKSEITRATMNRSKDHLDGVGAFPGGIFFFNVTKP